MKPNRTLTKLVWLATILLSLIGIAIVTRRTRNLLTPPVAVPELAALDSGFAPHPVLTMIHILPRLLFAVLAPFQFVPAIRRRWPRLHRINGRVLLGCGLIIGTTALIMSPQMAIGGANETAATMLFATVFLFALIKAYLAIRRGRVAQHREWMIRAFAVGMAVATVRPIVGMFFATRGRTHLTPHDFFGIAFWLGFTIQLIVAEAWINYTRVLTRAGSE
jgi:uncharacterized membrane protein